MLRYNNLFCVYTFDHIISNTIIRTFEMLTKIKMIVMNSVIIFLSPEYSQFSKF